MRAERRVSRNGFDAVLGLLDRAACWGIVLAGTVMVAMVTVEVLTRYVLATSVIFANELARLCFVWMIFLGTPVALARGRHVGIGLANALLPPRAARGLVRIACLCSAVLMAIVLYQSWLYLIANWDEKLSTMPLSAGTFMLPIPICAALCLLLLLRMMLAEDPAAIVDDQTPVLE